MKVIKKILVCVDLSDYSEETLEYASSFRKSFDAEILLLNVINIRDIEALKRANDYYPDKVDITGYAEKSREDRKAKMQGMVSRYTPAELEKVRIEIVEGVPFEEILKCIDVERVDLVIMGNKGRSNLASTLFGSTAEKVFKYSNVPVVSVRNTM
ncbi:universal stress protein [Desulfosediminicola flagellatus]|uniref:universal stress protein n=1 Tax=Desulfosediminicola flagellatus TaxID=2569541 RepID=UPI0010ABC2E7|nr:universal stress protein [Desulfosediminicola flagellatus]